MSHVIASNASCAQYLSEACHDLPMTGYVVLPIVVIGLILIAIGVVGRRRNRP